MDVFIAACFYLWLQKGVDSARVVLLALLWFVAGCMWVIALFVRSQELERRDPVSAAYDWISSLAIVLGLAWAGESRLAVALLIAYIIVAAKRAAVSDEVKA